MSNELKSCPFCGSTDIEILHDTHSDFESGWFWTVGCVGCDAEVFHPTKEQAIELWNTRAPNWISVNDRLPKDKTPVFIVLNGVVRIGELLWEHPSYEDTYKAFRYWDDPYDDGQAWEWQDITHWSPMIEPPKKD